MKVNREGFPNLDEETEECENRQAETEQQVTTLALFVSPQS